MEKGSQASDLKTVVSAGADLAKGKGIKILLKSPRA